MMIINSFFYQSGVLNSSLYAHYISKGYYGLPYKRKQKYERIIKYIQR